MDWPFASEIYPGADNQGSQSIFARLGSSRNNFGIRKNVKSAYMLKGKPAHKKHVRLEIHWFIFHPPVVGFWLVNFLNQSLRSIGRNI